MLTCLSVMCDTCKLETVTEIYITVIHVVVFSSSTENLEVIMRISIEDIIFDK